MPALKNTLVHTASAFVVEGMTMLVATHGMGFAREVADRVVFINGGVVVEEGVAERVISAPAQSRT